VELKDAINRGKEKAAQAENKQALKSFDRPLTRNGIRQVFDLACRNNNYPEATLTKRTIDMLGGFIKVFQNSGVPAIDVYNFITEYVNNFNELKGSKYTTEKGSEWNIGNSPNLSDIVICRNAIWAELYRIKNDKAKCTQVHKIKCTREDFDSEYEEAMSRL